MSKKTRTKQLLGSEKSLEMIYSSSLRLTVLWGHGGQGTRRQATSEHAQSRIAGHVGDSIVPTVQL